MIRSIATSALLAALRALSSLPWSWQRRLGAGLGLIALRLQIRRRRIAAINIDLCFPELDEAARKEMLRAHFKALGTGLMELGMAWYASDKRIRRIGRVSGLDHVKALQASGQGILLFAGHFTCLDLASRVLGTQFEFVGVWRALGNPRFDASVKKGRLRGVSRLIEKSSFRHALKALKAGEALFLAVDQADTTKTAIEAPFFEQPAMTISSPQRLAKASACALVPMRYSRDRSGIIHVTLEGALENFEELQAEQAAALLNATIEAQVKDNPEQYYWVHRRFKKPGSTLYD